jgi:hypothetical protein
MMPIYYKLMEKSSFGSIPFIPGFAPTKPELLARHLPTIPEGIVSAWLQANIPQGAWVLDPFGASPRIAMEAAQAGYRVLVAANNPIARFLLEMIAHPPTTDELKAALAELAASYLGEERIEPHIRSLYNTICARCGQTISADAFLWEYGNPSPYARIYTCPNCGDSGEHPCTSFDAAFSSSFVNSGLHKARALERVVAFNDQDRIHVEQALSVYTPRALYALITIINKVQGLNLSPSSQKHLYTLLLYSFDQANSMWRPQAQGEKRRQLSIPRHSRENNVWKALEDGINKWSVDKSTEMNAGIPFSIWPEILPDSAGICIYEGRLVNLIETIKGLEIKSICASIPRPNQAYWTLCALWAGWLWGREAVGTFKSVLHRQRYDWAWHTNALASVFKQLANFLTPSTPIVGLLGEAEPGFVGSVMVAAGVAGFHFESIAIRSEEKQAQIFYKSEKGHDIKHQEAALTLSAIQSARRYLELNGEPGCYLNTISAAFLGIINRWQSTGYDQNKDTVPEVIARSDQKPVSQTEPVPAVLYSNIYNAAREALSYRNGFLKFNIPDEKSIESSSKTTNIQATLFSMEINATSEDEDETPAVEVSSTDIEASPEKELPVRSSDVSESTHLWLRETSGINRVSSTDNYETFLFNYLLNHPTCTLAELDNSICSEFPSLFTPDSEFVRLFLDSYGQPDPLNTDHWSLRVEDQPDDRLSDITQIQRTLHQIGDRLDFDCYDQLTSHTYPYILWQAKKSTLQYWFFVSATAAMSEIVIHGEQPPVKGFVVFPASRANLLIYKLRHDQRLNRAFNPIQGVWQFLKFRHVRSLLESPLLTRDNLDQFLRLDPLTYTTPQLWLI